MITKLGIIQFLLDEIKVEQEKIKRYEEEETCARINFETDKEKGLTGQYEEWYYPKWFNPSIKDGNRTLILDNLKKIRRLTLRIEKEDM